MTTDALRAKWRRQKRAQRRKNPAAEAAKRRVYYAANREHVLERQRAYYYAVWKLRDAGVVP